MENIRTEDERHAYHNIFFVLTSPSGERRMVRTEGEFFFQFFRIGLLDDLNREQNFEL